MTPLDDLANGSNSHRFIAIFQMHRQDANRAEWGVDQSGEAIMIAREDIFTPRKRLEIKKFQVSQGISTEDRVPESKRVQGKRDIEISLFGNIPISSAPCEEFRLIEMKTPGG